MQVPAKVHYAVLAMLELAASEDRPEPLSIREIVSRHGIPQPFLVQILQQLKTAGWVSSTRGTGGGYRLNSGLSGLTLLEIAEAVGWTDSGCRVEASPSLVSHLLKEVWDEAAEAYRKVLASTTLADLIRRSESSETPMFYI